VSCPSLPAPFPLLLLLPQVLLFELSQLPVCSASFRDATKVLLGYAEASRECCGSILTGGFVPRILEAVQEATRSHNKAVRPGQSALGRNRSAPHRPRGEGGLV
jgi:hypothetical protein